MKTSALNLKESFLEMVQEKGVSISYDGLPCMHAACRYDEWIVEQWQQQCMDVLMEQIEHILWNYISMTHLPADVGKPSTKSVEIVPDLLDNVWSNLAEVPFHHQYVLVKKKDDTWRMCIYECSHS